MEKPEKSIGIIGGGFVGQILKQYYPEAKIYDIKPGKWDSLDDVLMQEYIFIAVNFPDNFLVKTKDVFHYLRSCLEGRKVIVKSTFVPGSCDWFQSQFPQHYFFYNPEFLTERTAWEDFTKPQFQIIGAPHQSLPYVREIFELLPKAPLNAAISPLDAEMIKHAKNSYYAMKVIFFNQLFDACQKLGGDYDTIRQLLVQDKWIGDSHSLIFHNGYRGFGGKCLVKDLSAFKKVAPSELLDKVEELNENLRAL